jgi:hypothetical protein
VGRIIPGGSSGRVVMTGLAGREVDVFISEDTWKSVEGCVRTVSDGHELGRPIAFS